jgi:hypothetical protein
MIEFKLKTINNSYAFEMMIREKLTLIRGDSATGKSTLIDRLLSADTNASPYKVECSLPYIALNSNHYGWRRVLQDEENAIIFMDEGFSGFYSTEFTELVFKSNNYFVFTTRQEFPSLNYDIRELYLMRNQKKLWYLEPMYKCDEKLVKPELIITEDSKGGYKFFKNLGDRYGIKCISAKGKSNAAAIALKNRRTRTLVVVDSLAFGSEMRRFDEFLSEGYVQFFAARSFEYMLLNSMMFGKEGVAICEEAEGLPLGSLNLEQFYYRRIRSLTSSHFCAYDKTRLSNCYIKDCCCFRGIKPCDYMVLGDKLHILLGKYLDRFWFA